MASGRSCAVAVLGVLLFAAAPGPLAAAGRGASTPVVAGYVETIYGGAGVADLDLGPVTHVIDAFVLPERDGRLRPVNNLPRRDLIDRCHAEGRLVLVSVGGGTVPAEMFAGVAGRERYRERFVTDLVRFAVEAGYDGVDIDWEFPEPDQRSLYVELIRRLRAEMTAAGWQTAQGGPALLMYGVSTGYWLNGYDFRELATLTDYAVYFGYDFRNPALGPWMHYEMMWPKGADEPMEASVSAVVAEIARRGYPAGQILVGLPFYTSSGRPWTAVRGDAQVARARLHPLYLEKNVGGEWVNDAEAIRAKAAAALADNVAAGRPAGGVAVWQLGHQGPWNELTGAIGEAVSGRGATFGAPNNSEVAKP
jgi:hypothetical protein